MRHTTGRFCATLALLYFSTVAYSSDLELAHGVDNYSVKWVQPVHSDAQFVRSEGDSSDGVDCLLAQLKRPNQACSIETTVKSANSVSFRYKATHPPENAEFRFEVIRAGKVLDHQVLEPSTQWQVHESEFPKQSTLRWRFTRDVEESDAQFSAMLDAVRFTPKNDIYKTEIAKKNGEGDPYELPRIRAKGPVVSDRYYGLLFTREGGDFPSLEQIKSTKYTKTDTIEFEDQFWEQRDYLIVLLPPPSLSKLKTYVIRKPVGEKIELACEAEGAPKLRYQWYFRESQDEKRELVSQGNILRLEHVSKEHTGYYSVRVSNLTDSTDESNEVKVVVGRPPVQAQLHFTDLEENVLEVIGGVLKVKEGDTLRVNARTESDADRPLSYEWSGAEGTEHLATLGPLIKDVDVSCCIKNEFGSAEIAVHIDVQTRPFIDPFPKEANVMVGDYVLLDARPKSNDLAIEYAWYRDGRLIPNSNNSQIIVDTNSETSTELDFKVVASIGPSTISEPVTIRTFNVVPFSHPSIGKMVPFPSTGKNGFHRGNNGFDKERPQHLVFLNHGFWVGDQEVTENQWHDIIGGKPLEGRGELPKSVSWKDAVAFCEKLTEQLSLEHSAVPKEYAELLKGYHFSLPTEAQWEYVAKKAYAALAEERKSLDTVCWHSGNAKGLQNVRTTKSDLLGLHDLFGNTMEWTLDWYAQYNDREASDPMGPSTGEFKILRGGSASLPATSCRPSFRYTARPSQIDQEFGFRVVLKRKPDIVESGEPGSSSAATTGRSSEQ